MDSLLVITIPMTLIVIGIALNSFHIVHDQSRLDTFQCALTFWIIKEQRSAVRNDLVAERVILSSNKNSRSVQYWTIVVSKAACGWLS